MDCSDVQKRVAALFDADQLTKLPVDIQRHVDTCTACQEYVHSLGPLEQEISQLPFSEPIGMEEDLRLIQERIVASKPKKRFRRAWLIAAALLLLVSLLLINTLINKMNKNKLLVNYEFSLYEARIKNRYANTVIFKSQQAGEPIIVWIY